MDIFRKVGMDMRLLPPPTPNIAQFYDMVSDHPNPAQVEPPVIPILQEIERPSSVKEFDIEGWDTYFYKEVSGGWRCG